MRQCKTFSNVYRSTDSAAYSNTVEVVPSGTRCVLGVFCLDLSAYSIFGPPTSTTYTDQPRVAFQSMDSSFTTKFSVPAVNFQYGLVPPAFGGARSGVPNKVPGPGILFEDGLRLEIDIPIGFDNSDGVDKSLFVSVNLIYSV